MSRLRQAHGFTVVEVLVVCTISLVVFGATLSVFTSLVRNNRQAELQRDNVELARQAIDHAARQLRNLANPTVTATNTIDRAAPQDFVFQTSDPAKTWVRYCLDGNGRLWEAESTGALTAAMRAGCPGSGWTRMPRMVSQNVTNAARPVFTYACSPTTAAPGCPAGTADLAKITSVRFELFVDARAGDRVREMRVSTAVYLRNQNEAPTAKVTWTQAGARKVVLNGSGSSDPEGRTLSYFWFTDTAPTATELASCTAAPERAIWEGPVLTHGFETTEGAAGTPKQFWLVVRDPGCLIDIATPEPVVTIP